MQIEMWNKKMLRAYHIWVETGRNGEWHIVVRYIVVMVVRMVWLVFVIICVVCASTSFYKESIIYTWVLFMLFNTVIRLFVIQFSVYEFRKRVQHTEQMIEMIRAKKK